MVAWSLVHWWQAGGHYRPQVNAGTTRSNHTENRCPHSPLPQAQQITDPPALDGSSSLCRTRRFHTCPSADYRHGTSINETKPMKPFEPPGERPEGNTKKCGSFSAKPSQFTQGHKEMLTLPPQQGRDVITALRQFPHMALVSKCASILMR